MNDPSGSFRSALVHSRRLPVFLAALVFFKLIAPIDDEGGLLPRNCAAARTGTNNDRRADGPDWANTLRQAQQPLRAVRLGPAVRDQSLSAEGKVRDPVFKGLREDL